ncbi:MAG: bifunctional precorrin-2 dehydrogenase/sirohydrochlorin ferrochelatase, partial [Desulfovibrionaceae bacterium]|nr:bifunctional precorrin-2 dehydrogenase/sirohydrochlorin ferrochelatase [Desulfovibrionaceae bacterium]
WHGELDEWIFKRRSMVKLMGRLRPKILELNLGAKDNRKIFRALAHGPLEKFLQVEDISKARNWLRANLPAPLKNSVDEFLVDL